MTTTEKTTAAIPAALAQMITEARARQGTEEEEMRRAKEAHAEQARQNVIEALREDMLECIGTRMLSLLKPTFESWQSTDVAWSAYAEMRLGDYLVGAKVDHGIHGYWTLVWTIIKYGERFTAASALEIGPNETQEYNVEKLLQWLGSVLEPEKGMPA